MGDGTTVRLRPVVPSDLPVHFEQQRDPESNALAAVPPRAFGAFEQHWARILADPAVVVRTVLADGAVAGSALSFVRDRSGRWAGAPACGSIGLAP